MADIDSILVSFSASVPYLQKLITGAGYFFGIFFIFSAIVSLGELSDKYRKQDVKGGWTHPMAYLLAGAGLLWFPTTMDVLNATFFGSDSPLSYSGDVYKSLQEDIHYIIQQMVVMLGVFWVVHGFMLFTHAPKADSNDEQRSGKKAWLFIFGGLLATNNDLTIELIQSTAQTLVQAKYNLYPIQQTIESYF